MRGGAERLRSRAHEFGHDTYRRLRTYLIVAVQAGIAAALSWAVATRVLHNPDPTFAPAAAVAVVAAALGNRTRRAIELVAGVLVGLAVGDLLVRAVGTGGWQTGAIVFLAIIMAVLVRGGGALVTQAGGTAVLIATLSPGNPDLELPRTINALLGTAAGLLVSLVVAPLNPLRTLRRGAGPALDIFARELTAAAEALVGRDVRAAEQALDRMRTSDAELDQLREIAAAAFEVARWSPLRWLQRNRLESYRQSQEHMDRAIGNSQVMIRRIVALLRADEPVPAELPAAVDRLGEAVRLLYREFLADREPVSTRERALAAVRAGGAACRQDIGFSGTIVVSQLQTVANELLRATGVSRGEARQLVRRAASDVGAVVPVGDR